MTFLRSGQKSLLNTLVQIKRGVYERLSKLDDGVLKVLPEVPVNLCGENCPQCCVVKLVAGEDVEMSAKSQRNLIPAGAGRRHGGYQEDVKQLQLEMGKYFWRAGRDNKYLWLPMQSVNPFYKLFLAI